MNPLLELQHYGQSVWLDYIRRSLITSGELTRLVADDGLRGVTSNPAIFEKAIAGSSDYANELDTLGRRRDLDAKAIYEALAIRDVRDAADILKSLYEATRRAGRLRKPGGLARPRPGHGGHAGGGPPAVESRRPGQRHDQGPGHAGRHSRHPAAHC